ncbi:Enolase 1 [Morus notabilis]|uniref:phosphopyruvate hydratase n=1 Tax=Morus notabilis TaxID=981085 RepID=W9QJU7_9ROSA|nr:Enolase 1 [Morus notabilis]
MAKSRSKKMLQVKKLRHTKKKNFGHSVTTKEDLKAKKKNLGSPTMAKRIVRIKARKIYDSRGFPTIEVKVSLVGSVFGLVFDRPAIEKSWPLTARNCERESEKKKRKGGGTTEEVRRRRNISKVRLRVISDLREAEGANNETSQNICGATLLDVYESLRIEVEKAIKQKTCNALLLEVPASFRSLTFQVNQMKSATKSIEAVNMSRRAGWSVGLASHGCGEKYDTFAADLAVGLAVGQYKIGAPSNNMRLDVFKRLTEISMDVRKDGRYHGPHKPDSDTV